MQVQFATESAKAAGDTLVAMQTAQKGLEQQMKGLSTEKIDACHIFCFFLFPIMLLLSHYLANDG